MSNKLTYADIVNAAAILKCEPSSIAAVAEVEAPEGGFLADGRVKVLFEGHQFYRYAKGRFAESHPTLCHPKWTRANYARGANAEIRSAREWDRLDAAIALDRTAALMSASFGRFQIMGFNFALCEFTNVEDFVGAMKISEAEHLNAFCKYIRSVGLDDELREHRWVDFARKYNGPEYRKNRYDEKLAAAHISAQAVTA